MGPIDVLQVYETIPLRVRQVAALVAMGMPDEEIASCLSITVRTVQEHAKRAREAFHVDTRLKLVLLIVRRPKLEKLLRSSLMVPSPRRGQGRSAQTADLPCDSSLETHKE